MWPGQQFADVFTCYRAKIQLLSPQPSCHLSLSIFAQAFRFYLPVCLLFEVLLAMFTIAYRYYISYQKN